MARLCSIDGCGKAHRARGLCNTHYNRTLPNRHRKVMVPCECCGQLTAKEARTKRYVGTFCSLLCRDFTRWGALTCELPATHWARMFGTTCDWEPQASRPAFQCGTCDDCETPIVEPIGQTPSTYCGEQCAARSARRRRRAREHSAPGTFRFSDVMRQYRRQGHVCAYCKRRPSGLPDPEHVLPLSRGGRNDLSNLVAACRLCNSDKCDMTLTEWADDRARRGLEPVDTALDGDAFKHLVRTEPTGAAWRHAEAA